MQKKIFFLIFLTILFLNIYSQNNEIIKKQDTNSLIKGIFYPNCVFYEIFVQSFYDTNNDGVVDNSELVNNLTVETAVPVSALFTDTI